MPCIHAAFANKHKINKYPLLILVELLIITSC